VFHITLPTMMMHGHTQIKFTAQPFVSNATSQTEKDTITAYSTTGRKDSMTSQPMRRLSRNREYIVTEGGNLTSF
jgi:hypothetical protein